MSALSMPTAGNWVQRLQRLRWFGAMPRDALFAADTPDAHTGKRMKLTGKSKVSRSRRERRLPRLATRLALFSLPKWTENGFTDCQRDCPVA
jgi:hypothetical protein